jgi:uncharacterized membrane protein YiaA
MSSLFRRFHKLVEQKFAHTGIEEIISHGLILIGITLLLVIILNLTKTVNLSILYEVFLSITIFIALLYLWLLEEIKLTLKTAFLL